METPIEKLSKNPPGPHRHPLLAAAFLDLPLQLRSSLGRLILQVILQGRRRATRQLFARDLDADPTTLRARALPECETILWEKWSEHGKIRRIFSDFLNWMGKSTGKMSSMKPNFQNKLDGMKLGKN